MTMVSCGDVLRARKPLRVGLGGGPKANGLCAVGDKFLVVGVCEDELALLYLWPNHPYVIHASPEVVGPILRWCWRTRPDFYGDPGMNGRPTILEGES